MFKTQSQSQRLPLVVNSSASITIKMDFSIEEAHNLRYRHDAETLADPYKGKTPLPRVNHYQEPFASRHPNTNTWKTTTNQYLEESPETQYHRTHSFPPIATE